MKWDKNRLIDGKLEKFSKIGGEGIEFKTSSGEKIVGCYFKASKFFQKINEMGGQLIRQTNEIKHPFFRHAKPVTIHTGNDSPLQGVRITYESSLEDNFRNCKEFINFCQGKALKVIWEDTLKPVHPSEEFSSSRKKNILIVKATTFSSLEKNLSSPKILETVEFDKAFEVFTSTSHQLDQIVFQNKKKCAPIFLEKGCLALKDTSWLKISDGGQFTCQKGPQIPSHYSFVETKKIFAPNVTDTTSKGVVVLGMNQTDSFSQYSDEILEFLLMGIDVIPYDQAGKGLSIGINDENNLSESVLRIGRCLTQNFGFSPNQIVFKGQCAGGIQISEASKEFPNAHMWIDQAPRSYANASGRSFIKGEENNPMKLRIWLSELACRITKFIFKPVVKILPNFDVVKGLERARGLKIYTIGVPDENGKGGDSFVSEEDKRAIKAHIKQTENGHYLTISGGDHVTDWFSDKDLAKRIKKIFKEQELLNDFFKSSSEPSSKGVNGDLVQL